MGRRRIAAIALSGALVAGGTGAAIAAVSRDDGRQAERAVLADAAKRLNVAPEKLREALGAAQDAQIDRAVKDGDLTQKQADAMKAARGQAGRVLGPFAGPGPGGRHFGPGGGPHFGMRGGLLDDVAKALGTTPAKLFESLRSGKSIADIAKANGTSIADVRAAAKAAVKTSLDTAVTAGDLTQKQADEMLARVDDKLAAITSGKALRFRGHVHRGAKRPQGEMRPGGLLPGREAPQLVPHGRTYS